MPGKQGSRRSPPNGRWSKCQAVIDSQGGQITIPFFYEDESALRQDWSDVGRWRKIPGATALKRVLRLEKSQKGRPWIEFGIQARYPHRITQHASPRRLAIPVEGGGRSRPAVIKAVRNSCELYVVFVLVLPGEWNRELQRLAHTGTACSAPGTEPIALDGLEAFGRYVRVGSQVPRAQEPA